MGAALQLVTKERTSLTGRQLIHHNIHVERKYRVTTDNSRQPDDRRRARETKKRTFRTDLEQAFGTAGHPKAELLFKLAYEYGEDVGHEEILDKYMEMKELLS